MIQLTRLNNSALVLNAELIKFVESVPDTVITLVSGEKIIVRESADEVTKRVIEFRRSIHQAPIAPCLSDSDASEGGHDRQQNRSIETG